MVAYYNEIDPFAANWLRRLISKKLIPDGVVDERSIEEVKPKELKDFTQCHFFAGIGGWAYALRLAGWPDDKPVWTGSCPCQSFSIAGKKEGTVDQRHLWPSWEWQIRFNRPTTIFGEQVEGAIRVGWYDIVSNALEAQGYSIGSAIIPACSIGAPHIRKRLWFVAHTDESRLERQKGIKSTSKRILRSNGMANKNPSLNAWKDREWVECRDDKRRPIEPKSFPLANGIPERLGRLRAYGNSIVPQVAAKFIQAYLNAQAST